MIEPWTDDIRKKMLSYEEAAPDADWHSLDNVLATRRKRATTRRIHSLWIRRWAVAAAVLFLLSGAFIYFQYNTDNVAKTTAKNKSTVVPTDSTCINNNEQVITQKDKRLMAMVHCKQASVSTAVEDVTNYMQEATKETVSADSIHVETREEKPKTDETRQYNKRQPLPPSIRQRGSQRLTAKLYFGNVMSGYNDSEPNGYMFAAASPLGTCDDANMLENKEQPAQTSSSEETSIKHRQPMRYGLSLRYQLDSHWSFETGLTYSYLRSDITVSNATYQQATVQRLHYIGIPLMASLSILRTGGFGIYVSAGATVEKMVAGKAESTTRYGGDSEDKSTETLTIHPLQLSVGCSMGAEYMFAKTAGVYLEPCLNYYFDNHSSVSTIYADKPSNFSLNVGLRINLSR